MARRSLEYPKGSTINDVCRRFGLHLRTSRRRMGYTQEQLADRLDLSANFIAHLERGSRKPSLDTLVALARFLEVPLEDFLKLDAAPAASSKESPMVRRVCRMIKEAPESRVRLVASLLEEMPNPAPEPRPRRGRHR
jgi:transcriptional regulator with XRE-family HTH domain